MENVLRKPFPVDPPPQPGPSEEGGSLADSSHSATREARSTFPVLRAFVLIVLFALLILPGIETLRTARTGQGDKARLGGVEKAVSFPLPELSNFLSGGFQEQFERWLSNRIGWRGALIRTAHQVDLLLFGKVSGRLIHGKNHFLYESYYLEDYNNLRPVADEQLAAFGERLKRLDGLLRARGVAFLVMLTPSKVSIYPENLPSRLIFAAEPAQTYPRFREVLEQNGVPFFDSVELVRKLKQEQPLPVFAAGGAHWTTYTACRVARGFMQRSTELLGKALPLPICDPAYIRETPRTVDSDLAKLTNLWTPSIFDAPTAYPRSSVEFPPDAYRAKFLFIGDSFLWTFFHFLEKKPVYESRDFYYYYQAEQRFRANMKSKPKQPLSREKVDWNRVFSRDVIVLELNEVRIREEGFGFVADALAKLEAAPK